MTHREHLRALKAFIFDLDGTLVTSSLDFFAMKKEIGCHADNDVLKFAASQDNPAETARVMSVIERHEIEDALSSQPIDGALDFIKLLRSRDIPVAIVTRNCRRAASLKIKRAGLPITDEWLVTREDAPPKPEPDALWAIADRWQIDPADIAYVGDYLFDVDAAINARMTACILLTDHSRETEYAQRAHYSFFHYGDFADLLKG